MGADEALKKGERGTMVINALRWDSKFGGMITSLTIVGTVTIGSDEPYEVEVGRQNIPHYASHLPAVGRTVPVVVSLKRADKVTIDWPSAVLAEPGIGVAPATTVDQSQGAPRTLMSMGGPPAGAPVSSMGMSTPPPPPPPAAAFTPPAPVEGVTWAQYLTIEKAILASGGYNRKTAALVEGYGLSFATYTKASAAFGKAMVRDVALQQSFVAGMQ